MIFEGLGKNNGIDMAKIYWMHFFKGTIGEFLLICWGRFTFLSDLHSCIFPQFANSIATRNP